MSVIAVIATGSPVILVEREPQPKWAPGDEKAVEAAWSRAIERRPWLHDGELFSVTHSSSDEIRGTFVPYRFFVAQQEDPSLAPRLKVAPLGVTGRTRTSDGAVVLARRGCHVYQDAGLWELAPAGGVHRGASSESGRLDPLVVLEAELEEELGLNADVIVAAQIVGVLLDTSQNVYDVIVDIQLSVDRSHVERSFAERRTTEYDELTWWFSGDSLTPYGAALGPLVATVLGLPTPG